MHSNLSQITSRARSLRFGAFVVLTLWCQMVCRGAQAQDFAPESLADTVYYANGPTASDGKPSFVNQAVLSWNGTRTPINNASSVYEPNAATYTWAKTGPNTGTLGLTGSPVVSRMEITFTAAGKGTYHQFVTGRTTILAGEVFFAPVPRDLTPPLLNLSTRTLLVAGQPITMGFVIDGTVSRRVLVRAIGPTLAQFGVINAVANPALTVLNGSTQIAANAGWGGASAVATIFSKVGAFALPATSRDSAIVLNLEPGLYTAQVRSDTAGEVLLEIYFVD